MNVKRLFATLGNGDRKAVKKGRSSMRLPPPIFRIWRQYVLVLASWRSSASGWSTPRRYPLTLPRSGLPVNVGLRTNGSPAGISARGWPWWALADSSFSAIDATWCPGLARSGASHDAQPRAGFMNTFMRRLAVGLPSTFWAGKLVLLCAVSWGRCPLGVTRYRAGMLWFVLGRAGERSAPLR